MPVRLECPVGHLLLAVCPPPIPNHARLMLHPRELAYAATLEAGRQVEWTAGRFCLATAMEVALPREPILVLPSGAPAPLGMQRGSISHKGPMVAALAGSGACFGVDLECVEEEDVRIAKRVLTARERSANDLSAEYVSQCFAIKEAVYKALPDDSQRGLDFQDIEAQVPLSSSSWSEAHVSVNGQFDSNLRIFLLTRGAWTVAIATIDSDQG